MHSIGGLSFAVEPRSRLSEAEQRFLDPWVVARGQAQALSGEDSLTRIEIADEPWLTRPIDRLPAPFENAPVVDWIDGAVQVSHDLFHARLDAFTGRGRLWRRESTSSGLRATLRAALCARLPIEGGLPLHAAGLVIDGAGLVFFGPSGAGKSTLANLARSPLLSDELVAVSPDRPFAIAATAVWGTLGAREPLPGAFPLKALVQLRKGPGLSLSRLEPAAALRLLLGVTMVPVGPPLWSRALRVLGDLVRAVPAWSMSWAPDTLDWERLAKSLD